ncbi:MAG: response regulator transcription factor [Bacteroidetes bacterium]|nr:response regulator transcription factor [Bacteroidota bacterium]
MTNCFIIDDEQPAIDVIQNYIKQIPILHLVGSSTNPLQAIETIKKNKVDLVFLDIHMDEMNGIEVIKHLDKNIKVILCTAYSEFAVASFDLDVVDYLMKPISFDRFERAIQRATFKTKDAVFPPVEKEIINDYIFIKTEYKGKMIKVDLVDIDYIEGKNNYVAFHIANKVIISHFTLRELEELLPKSSFIRVHKSYIVSIKKIVTVANSELKLSNYATPIPLSPNFKEAFMQRVSDKLIR